MPLAPLLVLLQLAPAPSPAPAPAPGPGPGPGPLAGHVLVWSARERAVLLVGGEAPGPRPLFRLADGAWHPIAGSELPGRALPAAAADAAGDLLVHGGALVVERPDGGRDFRVTGETWRWDGRAWTRAAEDGPAPRDHHALAFDSERGVFVLFGGSDADPSGRTTLFGDTWEWRDGEWELVAESGPSARVHHALVFDPVRKVTLLVGGAPDGVTWAWDGYEWRSVARGPPAERRAPRTTWDRVGARVLLFGGGSGTRLPSDTWAWDGARWSALAADGPPGRLVHALAFDVERGVAVLAGGSDHAGAVDDLWELAGDAWRRIRP